MLVRSVGVTYGQRLDRLSVMFSFSQVASIALSLRQVEAMYVGQSTKADVIGLVSFEE